MYFTRDQFVNAVTKLGAKSGGLHGAPGDESSVSGSQGEMQPEIDQPDQVKNDSRDQARGPEESLNQAAEALAAASTRGYLSSAMSNFDSAAKETHKDLGAVLDNYGPEAASSSEVAKSAAVRQEAFLDELAKIQQAG